MVEIKATLRVFSKELTLKKLKQKLGEPTHSYSIGDVYSRNKKKRDMSFWAMRSSRSPGGTLECHIGEILTFLDSRVDELKTIRNKCERDIFCMLSADNGQGSAVFSSRSTKLLAAHDIDVTLDLYMTPEDD